MRGVQTDGEFRRAPFPTPWSWEGVITSSQVEAPRLRVGAGTDGERLELYRPISITHEKSLVPNCVSGRLIFR